MQGGVGTSRMLADRFVTRDELLLIFLSSNDACIITPSLKLVGAIRGGKVVNCKDESNARVIVVVVVVAVSPEDE